MYLISGEPEFTLFAIDAKEISSKFIIMTAYNSPQVLNRANSYQCRLLNKPFDDLENALKIMVE
jgi:hypothetical protein